MQTSYYEFEWAQEVAEAFLRTCPRATKNCLVLAHLTFDDVAKLLQSKSKGWEIFKRATKQCKNYANCPLPQWTLARIQAVVRHFETPEWHKALRQSDVRPS